MAIRATAHPQATDYCHSEPKLTIGLNVNATVLI